MDQRYGICGKLLSGFLCTVFGVELDFLLQRECPEDEVPAGTVPAVLERLINEVEQRGLTEVGICASFFR